MAHVKHESLAKQEVDAPLILTTGIISLLLLAVAAAGTDAWYRYEEQAELADKWAQSENTWLKDIKDAQLATLDGKNGGKTIEQAMAAVAENHGKQR